MPSAWIDTLVRPFGVLDRLPVAGNFAGAEFLLAAETFQPAVGKHMRMAAQQLAGYFRRHVLKVEAAFLAGQLGVEDHLEQQIAQLSPQLAPVAAFNGLDHLVNFLDGMGNQRFESLLQIPRAAEFPIPQHRHQGEQPVHGRKLIPAFPVHVHD